MGDEELRARIEAQAAARRAAAPPPKRGRSGRNRYQADPGDVSPSPRSREPVRSWLVRLAMRPGALGAVVEVPAPGQRVDEPPAAAVEPVEADPSGPAQMLQEHWARRREALIAERAALRGEREALLAQRDTLSELRESRPTEVQPEMDPVPQPVSVLATDAALAARTVLPADVDDDKPAPPAAQRHRAGVRGASRLLIVVVIAAVLATLLRTYVVAPYYIPSSSMEPTLHGCSGCNNDHVLVDKLSYKMHDLHRGDVVVFHRPQAWQVTEKVLIKRVIGLPGDTLSARNGIVYVDGLALDEPYVDKACQSGTTNFPTKPVTVPHGQAYVMGDNRCDSSDSRRFGAIPDSAVLGRAFLIIWPFGRLHWL